MIGMFDRLRNYLVIDPVSSKYAVIGGLEGFINVLVR